MNSSRLEQIANAMLRRVENQAPVVADDIRRELTQAGLSPSLYTSVLDLIRAQAAYRDGRAYHSPPLRSRMKKLMNQQQSQQRALQTAIRRLIRSYRDDEIGKERRKQPRVQFVRSIQVFTEDHRELHVLSRDISVLGIRLVANCSLLGQKLRLRIPLATDDPQPYMFLVHILWSNVVGDGMFENGGMFVELLKNETEPLKIIDGK